MKHCRVADGTRIAYTLEGPPDAPVAVLCDGISCDGYVWRYLRPVLLERFQVLHMHYRGHGRSGLPRDAEAVTLPHLAGDLAELMQRHELGPAVFFGHSMGVQVVLEMAWRHPERVRAGVLVCGSYGRALDTFKNTDVGARVLPRIKELMTRYRPIAQRVVQAFMPTRFSFELAKLGEINRTLVRREDFMPYLDHFSRMPLDLFVTMLEDAAERTSVAFLHRLSQPFLVLAGERDGFTPAHTSQFLASTLPHGELEVLPGGSHTAPIELPDVLETRIRRFVDEHGLARPAAATPRPDTLAARWRVRRALVTAPAPELPAEPRASAAAG